MGTNGAFTRSHEAEGEGRANATLRGSWALWKHAARATSCSPPWVARLDPPLRREERKGGSLLGKAPGQVSRSRKCTALGDLSQPLGARETTWPPALCWGQL